MSLNVFLYSIKLHCRNHFVNFLSCLLSILDATYFSGNLKGHCFSEVENSVFITASILVFMIEFIYLIKDWTLFLYMREIMTGIMVLLPKLLSYI